MTEQTSGFGAVRPDVKSGAGKPSSPKTHPNDSESWDGSANAKMMKKGGKVMKPKMKKKKK